MISNGGDQVGPSKLTKEIIDVVSQVPPMLEAVTGVDLKGMIQRIHEKPSEKGEAESEKSKPTNPKK